MNVKQYIFITWTHLNVSGGAEEKENLRMLINYFMNIEFRIYIGAPTP